jgi:hypothetical protein
MISGVSISDAEKAGVRAAIFTHLAGLAVAPTVGALWERGAIHVLTGAAGPVEFSEILARTHANAGYLRVALRLLASCGWLTVQPAAVGAPNGSPGAAAALGMPNKVLAYELTDEGRIAMTLAPLYGELTSFFLPKALILEDYVFGPSDEPLIPSLREPGSERRTLALADAVTARVRLSRRGHLTACSSAPRWWRWRGGVLDASTMDRSTPRARTTPPASRACSICSRSRVDAQTDRACS